jgi:hypothetical protein
MSQTLADGRTVSRNDERAAKREMRYGKIACIYLTLFIGFFVIGALFINRNQDQRVIFRMDQVTYNTMPLNVSASPFVRHVPDAQLVSVPYVLFLVISSVSNMAVYLVSFIWMARRFASSSSRPPSEQPKGEIQKPVLDPNEYHAVTLTMTRFFTDMMMACVVTNLISDRGLMSSLHTVCAVILLHLCYLVGDAYYVHLYAAFPRSEAGDAILTMNQAHYMLAFAILAGWVLAMFALIHPLRGVSVPIEVSRPFIVFLTKLSLDSLMHASNLMAIWGTFFKHVITLCLPSTALRRNIKMNTITNGDWTIDVIVMNHLADAVLFWIFVIFMDQLYMTSTT